MDVTNSLYLRFAKALTSRSFALLWLGQTISSLGNGAFSTALAWEVLLLTNSATAMGAVIIAQSIPMLLFLLLGGVVADLLPRRLIMLWSDTVRAIIVLLIAGLVWLNMLQLWHLVVMSFCFGIVKCFFDPAYQAIRPQLVEKDKLASANALTGLSRKFAILLSPLLGVGLVTFAGPASAFAFNSLSFFISAFFILILRVPSLHLSTKSQNASAKPLSPWQNISLYQNASKVLISVKEGLSYLTSSKWLWISIVVTSIFNIGYAGSLGVALPKLVHDVYHANVELLGVMITLGATGAIAATMTTDILTRLHRRGIVAYFALLVCCFAIIAMGLPLSQSVGMAVLIIASILNGWGLATFDIIWSTLIQEMIPNDKLGRVDSIDSLASFMFTPIGYALGGIVADQISPSWVFVLGGILGLLAVISGLCIRDTRQLK